MCEIIIISVNPVHNAPVPPPRRYLLRTRSNLSSCTIVVNAPRSCWPDVIQKKKDKKRSKYVALDFSEKTNPKKRLKKKQIRSKIGLCGSFLGGCRIGIAETVNRSERPITDGRTDV